MFKSWTLGRRIGAGFVFVLALLAVLGAVGVVTTLRTEIAMNVVRVDSLPGVYEIGNLAACLGHIRVLTVMEVNAVDTGQKASFREEIGRREQEFDDIATRYEQTITTSEDRALFRKIPPAWQRYRNAVQRVLELSGQSKSKKPTNCIRRRHAP